MTDRDLARHLGLTPEEVRARRASGPEIKVLSVEYVSGHTYRITTESVEYGRVTQTVLILPESFWQRWEQQKKP